MEGQLIIVMAELMFVAGSQGAQRYLAHRKRLVADGREDELLSSRVRKVAVQIKEMSRHTTPVKQREEPELELEAIYPDELEVEPEVAHEVHKPLAESLLDAQPKRPISIMKQRRSSLGLNSAVSALKTMLKPSLPAAVPQIKQDQFWLFALDVLKVLLLEFEEQQREPMQLKHRQYRKLFLNTLAALDREK
jgi:hypothetical protein